MTAPGTARVTRAPDILSRTCLTSVLVRLRGAPTISLTEAAAEVWGLLDVDRTVDEVAEALAARHGTTATAVLDDLQRLVDDLVALGVVLPAPGIPSASTR
ncbi:MAG: PqqD family protein [Acidimicrobiales bacterium]